MDRYDVRLRHLRGGTGFALEALAECGVRGKRWRQQLDGDQSIERDLAREIDDTHATAPQLPFEGVSSSEGGLKVEEELVDRLGHRRTYGFFLVFAR